MAGRELVVRKEGNLNVRELGARVTLREVQLKGHSYVELRPAGKRNIFFCTLCQTPCFSDSVLFDHLRGNLHARRYAVAKMTLFGPLPWPFSDGVLFFDNSSKKGLFLEANDSGNGRALVVRDGVNGDEMLSNGESRLCNYHGFGGATDCSSGLEIATDRHPRTRRCNGVTGTGINGHCVVSRCNEKGDCLMIPGVLYRDEVSDLKVRFIGFGHIASKVLETNGVATSSKIGKIWCAWLGERSDDDMEVLAESLRCDFGIVSFRYTYDLGRKWPLEEPKLLLSAGSCSEVEEIDSPGKKAKKSLSDPEDSSSAIVNSCVSSGEDCSSMDGHAADGAHRYRASRFLSGKALRRELRRQKRIAAERMCDICGQSMLPGKDVGTLLNLKTGNLACSSRNTNGAFHLFHVSCLIHWILVCETEMWRDQSSNKKTVRRRKRKVQEKKGLCAILCPECQGTGIHIVGDELEKPTVSLTEMFLHKLKTIESHNAWMKNPEVLQKCSTGLFFSSDSTEDMQEKVIPMKLLYFYQNDEIEADQEELGIQGL